MAQNNALSRTYKRTPVRGGGTLNRKLDPSVYGARRLKPDPAPPERFSRNEKVSGAVAQRSGARLAALGGKVKGVDGTDGYTGHEARLIKTARAKQKDKRPSLYAGPYRRTA